VRPRTRPLLLAGSALVLALAAAWATLGAANAQVPGRMRDVPEPPSPPSSTLPTVTPTVRFTDVAGRSTFSYVSNNDYREKSRKYFPQPMCGGVALLDYDGDGKLDVFFTNGGKLPDYTRPDPSYYSCLLRGRGDGTFEEVTLKAKVEGKNLDISYGVAVGDYDNDGHPDLFVANAGPNALYHNNGDGTFSETTPGSGLDRKPKDLLSVCAAFFDYDNDGLLDLVVSQYTFWNPKVDRVCPTSEGEIYCYPGTYPSVAHSLYHNLGNGKFEDVGQKAGFDALKGKGMGIGIADFNGDGWMDVFIANDTEPNFLYINQGNGTFKDESWSWGIAYDEQGAVVSGMGADARDFNDDGFPDVFYNNLQSQIWALFQNEGGTHFRYVSPRSGVARLSRRFSGWSNAIFDYDNDGWKDIYSANGDVDYLGANSEQRDTMFHNVDGKVFADVSEGLGPDFVPKGYQRGSAYGDLDGDGFPDLVVTSLNRRPRILLNSGDNGRHWLWLDLVGKKSNRDAIGARVKLTTSSGRVLHNHVSPSVGFMSSSDRKLHFGLGGDSAAKTVEIRWPSGKTQTLENVKADQRLRVDEPL
jgi:enediyne biosynthesis protein E4